MCDFESAMRNAAKKAFKNVKLTGCYFHFTKSLFDKVASLGLGKSDFKKKSYLLICYLQILIHCASEKRKELFEEVINIFENGDLRFKAFLGYFKKELARSSIFR